MTTATISTYYCNFCDAVKTVAIKFGKGFWAFAESYGRARAASMLSQQGFHKEARNLMLLDLGETK